MGLYNYQWVGRIQGKMNMGDHLPSSESLTALQPQLPVPWQG